MICISFVRAEAKESAGNRTRGMDFIIRLILARGFGVLEFTLSSYGLRAVRNDKDRRLAQTNHDTAWTRSTRSIGRWCWESVERIERPLIGSICVGHVARWSWGKDQEEQSGRAIVLPSDGHRMINERSVSAINWSIYFNVWYLL